MIIRRFMVSVAALPGESPAATEARLFKAIQAGAGACRGEGFDFGIVAYDFAIGDEAAMKSTYVLRSGGQSEPSRRTS